MNDEEIMKAIVEYQNNININENFERIEKQYRKMIYSLIKTKTSDIDRCFMSIDDIYQECLILLMKILKKFDTTKNILFSTFYYKCATNKIIDIQKQRSMKNYRNNNYELKDYDICDTSNSISKIEDEMDNKILYNKLMEILNEILEIDEFTVYILKTYHLMTYKEITEIFNEKFKTNISISKIYSIYKSAHKKITENSKIKQFEEENFDSSHTVDTFNPFNV